MPQPEISSAPVFSPWRACAAKIVEELFQVTPTAEWDGLLDLRRLLLRGEDWVEVIEMFGSCRHALEEDHYLPFYRLRRLLAAHLRLENGEGTGVGSVAALLRNRRFSKRRSLAGKETLRLVEQP